MRLAASPLGDTDSCLTRIPSLGSLPTHGFERSMRLVVFVRLQDFVQLAQLDGTVFTRQLIGQCPDAGCFPVQVADVLPSLVSLICL